MGVLKCLQKLCFCKKNTTEYLLIEQNNKQINIINSVKKEKINMLMDISINELAYFFTSLTVDRFLFLNIGSTFIINFHNQYRVICSEEELVLLNKIISKLVTFYLFLNPKYNIDLVMFLSTRKHLFNVKLWTTLLMDPNYHNDSDRLFTTAYLHRHRIIDLFEPNNYCNLECNLFELILFGKIKQSNNPINNNYIILNFEPFNNDKLYWYRFFDMTTIIKFINKVKIERIKNTKIVNMLAQFTWNKNISNKYPNTIIQLLSRNNHYY